jgi:hypothetical protein
MSGRASYACSLPSSVRMTMVLFFKGVAKGGQIIYQLRFPLASGSESPRFSQAQNLVTPTGKFLPVLGTCRVDGRISSLYFLTSSKPYLFHIRENSLRKSSKDQQ